MTDDISPKDLAQTVSEEDETIWSDLKYLADDQGLDLEDVVEQLLEWYQEDIYPDDMDHETRALHAARVTANHLKANYLGPDTEPFEVVILDKTSPRNITVTRDGDDEQTQVANLYGVGTHQDSDHLAFVNVACWDEQVETVADYEVGTAYLLRCTGGLEDGVYDLNATQATNPQELDEQPDLDPLDVLREQFPVVSIAEAGQHVGESRSDLVLVEADVAHAQVRQGRNGQPFGRLVIADQSTSAQSVKEDNAAMSVMVDPEQVRCGGGSIAWVLGQITDSEEYGLGMNARVVLPIVATDPPNVPDTPEPEDVELGEEPVDDDEDVVDFSDL